MCGVAAEREEEKEMHCYILTAITHGAVTLLHEVMAAKLPSIDRILFSRCVLKYKKVPSWKE